MPLRRASAVCLLVWSLGACGPSPRGSAADAGTPEGGTGDTGELDGATGDREEAAADRREASAVDTRDAELNDERSDTEVDAASPDQASSDAPGTDANVPEAGGSDGPSPCGPCMEHWVCGGAEPEVLVTLVPTGDECHLSGLSGNKVLRPDGTITEDGVVVGSIMRTSARVRVAYPDGGEWLYCASPPTCTPWP